LFAFLIISISVFIIFQLGNAHFDLIHPAKMISNITHESFINLGLISGISLGGGLITGIGHYRNEKNKKHP